MRILHVVTAFPRYPGDLVSHWLVELVERLRDNGHEVEVLCPAYRGGGATDIGGIPVHRFRYFPARWEDLTHDEATPDRVRRSWRYRVIAAFYVAGGIVASWRLCRRRHYDIVHVHWPVPHALFGAVARSAGGARLVTLWYGVELHWVAGSLPWLRWFVRWALRSSDQVVAISSYTARAITSVADVAVRVIPYTVTLSKQPPAAGGTPGSVAPLRSARLQRNGGFRILFVGRLVERKGVANLLEAIRRLPPELDARLEVVGDGPERPKLEAQARRGGLAPRVTMRGGVSDQELRDAYGSADVVVLPSIRDSRSDTEGLGVVLLEAMAYGLPVIGSAIGGIPDIILDGETGLLVPPQDPAALAAALERLATDPGLAARLGQAGHQHARKNFSWDGIIARWNECYAAARRA